MTTESQNKIEKTNSTNNSTITWQSLNLSPQINSAILSLNFITPSPVQSKTIPLFSQMSSQPHLSLQVQSSTGSGKTAAFTIGLLSSIPSPTTSSNPPRCLILVPTRELAFQIQSVFQSFAHFTSHTVSGLSSSLSSQIIISTPGYFIKQYNSNTSLYSRLDWLLLDEADALMSNSSFKAQIMKISNNLKKNQNQIGNYLKLIFFSATYKTDSEPFFLKLIENYNNNFIQITEKVNSSSVSNQIETQEKMLKYDFVFYFNTKEEKYSALKGIYCLALISKAIIFCGTIAEAKELTNRLIEDSFKVGIIYGRGMEWTERDSIMKDFREGKTNILISTNLLSRGIDVVEINLVVNYSLPKDLNGVCVETYEHRVGRGGRYGRKNVAINLLEEGKENRRDIERIKEKGREVKEMKNDGINEFCEEMIKFLKD